MVFFKKITRLLTSRPGAWGGWELLLGGWTSANQLPATPGAGFILPKAEVCVRNHVQPYIPSILEALMVPTSQGFTEVRDVFFKEVTDMNLNVINEGGIDKLGEVRLPLILGWRGPPGFGSDLPPSRLHCEPGWAAPLPSPPGIACEQGLRG